MPIVFVSPQNDAGLFTFAIALGNHGYIIPSAGLLGFAKLVESCSFLALPRRRLAGLNVVAILTGQYCSHGIFACVTEIAVRTDPSWCSIKHARSMKTGPSRYEHFFDSGEAERDRKGIEQIRRPWF